MIERSRAAAVLLATALSSCNSPEPATAPAAGAQGAAPAARVPPMAERGHLRIEGSRFLHPDGTSFHWRGITAFPLLEMLARGRRSEVAAYLDWADRQELTIVRVLTMARHLFLLAPEDGRNALPELLDMAAARGLFVEVVVLADTAEMPLDADAHVAAVGAIAARYPNAVVEIANEPVHPTQDRRLHDPHEVARLARLIPDAVPVALGSAEEAAAFSAGEYATFHFPRTSRSGGWGYVLELVEGAALVKAWGKPLVNDEPMGAAAIAASGRRDNEPARFRAAALITRLTGMGGTFHYEGGLSGRIPEGREAECFAAWNEAWRLLPAAIESAGTFWQAGEEDAAVRAFDHSAALAVIGRQDADAATVLVVAPRRDPELELRPGWSVTTTERLDGVWILTAARSGESRTSSE